MTEKLLTPDEGERWYPLFCRIADALERIASSSVVVDTRAGTVSVTTAQYRHVAALESEAKTPQDTPLPKCGASDCVDAAVAGDVLCERHLKLRSAWSEAQVELAADIAARERTRALLGDDLYARLWALADDAVDPTVAKAVKPIAVSVLGQVTFDAAKDVCGVRAGECPTAKQLRQLATQFLANPRVTKP